METIIQPTEVNSNSSAIIKEKTAENPKPTSLSINNDLNHTEKVGATQALLTKISMKIH